MTILLIACQLLVASATVPGQIDRACFNGYCQFLAVQHGVVRYVDPTTPVPRNIVVGRYLPMDQRFVPRTEAPIRDLRSARGWHLVVSVLLIEREDVNNPRLRVRFFDSGRALRLTHDLLSRLGPAEVDRLFGGNDEIFAVTSEEEHAYNDQSEIWLLTGSGMPRRLLVIPGGFDKFTDGTIGGVPGVAISRQTYDGKHAETKGFAEEFYAWDAANKTLTLQKQ